MYISDCFVNNTFILKRTEHTKAIRNVEQNQNRTRQLPRTPQSRTRPHRKRPKRQRRQNLPQPNRNPTHPHRTSRRRRPRTVNETLCTIHDNPELRMIFEEIRPAGHSLKEIAKHLNLGVIEITPASAQIRGILANSTQVLFKAGLSIRQAIVDDPELSPEPKCTLIVDRKIPGELIPELLKIPGVAKVSVY